ncbi:hypothetical protein Bca4012_079720 [Brassica carinata]
MGRGRKVEMGRKIKMGPKEMKERHDLAMAKYYESLNKSEGKNLQLSRVKKYNRIQSSVTKVNARTYSIFDLKCTVARLLGETKKTITGGDDIKIDHPNLPELPQESPFVDDTKSKHTHLVGTLTVNSNPSTSQQRLFFTPFLPHKLKDSELEDNDWISLYLKLAVATTNKSFDVARLSLANLKILKVATESTQGLGDYDAVFYIEYEDSCEARVGKDVHRVAIVRRILDKQSEVLCLLGHNQSINNSAAMEAGSSSAQD